MSTKLICDYCLLPIEGGYTTMRITSLDAAAPTAVAEDTDVFEFHGGCYNTLQGLIVQLRGAEPPPALDPTPVPPQEQPTYDVDPEPPRPPMRSPDPVPAEEPPAEPAPVVQTDG